MLTRDDLLTPLSSPDALHAWLEVFLGLRLPRRAVCPGHDAPFDYMRTAYFEPSADQVVWSPRGGGKTRLAAAATLLDLLHKPAAQVRILGGSLEQALKMWDYLLPDVHRLAPDLLEGKPRGRTLTFNHGGRAAVLAQSERAVRGLRVQKLRCDEVELFKPNVWEAAQLTTRSTMAGGVKITGSIDALSTLHTPFGLMSKVIDDAAAAGKKTVRWCLLEVLERCDPQRDCATCPLFEDCGGIAKTRCDGFVTIDDAIRLKQRVSKETWQAEMLCRRPGVAGCVFPGFDPAVHVRETVPGHEVDEEDEGEFRLGVDFGFANPFVALWVHVAGGVHHVVDEYVQAQRTLPEHVAELKARPWPRAVQLACDPAGAARSSHTAASDVAVLKQAGYRVRHRASRVNEGVELVRHALCPAAGRPTLYVHPRCKRLVRALQAYRFAKGGSELPLKDGQHDHLIDALRYHLVNGKVAQAMSRRY
ncbi:MAG: hypothetical protein ACFCVE_01460 [Phycisphaerae bacterium]